MPGPASGVARTIPTAGQRDGREVQSWQHDGSSSRIAESRSLMRRHSRSRSFPPPRILGSIAENLWIKQIEEQVLDAGAISTTDGYLANAGCMPHLDGLPSGTWPGPRAASDDAVDEGAGGLG